MRKLVLLLAVTAASYAATPAWLDLVAPIITPAEKKIYLSLNGVEREKFEEAFWSGKGITAKDYSYRIDYVDTKFGSTKLGSGANTDQGRVYLALGPPNKITHIPSSRIFQPIEIWYYSEIPGVINTEVNLMFFQKNGVGLFKLYSPVRDTIRALLISQASTVNMFGPNDDLKESDIRNSLQVSPAEDEVVTAAVTVAAGVRYEENDAILGKVSSPAFMLGSPQATQVTSRIIATRPKLDILETAALYGGPQVDLGLEVTAQKQLDLEVLAGDLTVYQDHLNLQFPEPAPIRYTHRLDLLPGAYRLIFNVDGKHFPYSLVIPEHVAMGEILRADQTDMTADHHQTPFSFAGMQLDLNADGKVALVTLAQPEKVTWIIRRGTETVWRSVSEPAGVAWVLLPAGIPAGTYSIEANTANESKRAPLVMRADREGTARPTVISYNANLAPALRFAFVGHQWLLRGRLDEARKALAASLDRGATVETQIELARVDALAGQPDAARERVRAVLAADPKNFEALSVFAYVETRFQDYPAAAELYRKALTVQESPTVRAALAEIERRERGN
jgi:GWxTD domain-containing protein